MKVKVLRTFKDKYTKDLHKADEILDMTKERIAEINGTSLGAFVEVIDAAIKDDAKDEDDTTKEKELKDKREKSAKDKK
jgi:hypothetical protein